MGMDRADVNEMNSIKKELVSIAGQLEDISYEVRTQFTGVGNDICAKIIAGISAECRDAKRALDRIDTSNATTGRKG